MDDSATKFIRYNARLRLISNRVDKETVETRIYTRRYTIKGIYWRKLAEITWNIREIFRNNYFRRKYRDYWIERMNETQNKLLTLIELYRNDRPDLYYSLQGLKTINVILKLQGRKTISLHTYLKVNRILGYIEGDNDIIYTLYSKIGEKVEKDVKEKEERLMQIIKNKWYNIYVYITTYTENGKCFY